MAKRSPLVLPCLTAVGLLSACATALALESSADIATPTMDASDLAAPHRRPAVPPLPGPDSPLLQLGLVKPTPRPQVPSTSPQKSDRDEPGLDEQAALLPPSRSIDLPAPVAIAVTLDPPTEDIVAVALPENQFAPPTMPNLEVHPSVSVELGAASPETEAAEIAPVLFTPHFDGVDLRVQVAASDRIDLPTNDPAGIEIGDNLFALHSYGVDLPMRITANARIDLPASDVAGIEIGDILFAPRSTGVDLPVHYDIVVALPPASGAITVAELPAELLTVKPDSIDLRVDPVLVVELASADQETLAELLAPPAPRPREEKLAAAIRAQSQRAANPRAEGGPEVSFKLRH